MKAKSVVWFGLLLAFGASDVQSAESGGCSAFKWPLATELGWMTAGDPATVESGGEVPVAPEKAIALALVPETEAKLAVPASGKTKSRPEAPFAGTVKIAAISKPGTYQVSLSDAAWIDVVQDGKALVSASHTGSAGCAGLHKSVRFDLISGPAVLQITSAKTNSIRVTIKAAN